MCAAVRFRSISNYSATTLVGYKSVWGKEPSRARHSVSEMCRCDQVVSRSFLSKPRSAMAPCVGPLHRLHSLVAICGKINMLVSFSLSVALLTNIDLCFTGVCYTAVLHHLAVCCVHLYCFISCRTLYFFPLSLYCAAHVVIWETKACIQWREGWRKSFGLYWLLWELPEMCVLDCKLLTFRFCNPEGHL